MPEPLTIRTEGGFADVRWGALSGRAAAAFRLSPQDQEDVRWYLEDYVRYPSDPASSLAARIERQMVDWGVALFRAIFGGADTCAIWTQVKPQLSALRIEISNADPAIPWELLREDAGQPPLALQAGAFVRVPAAAPAAPPAAAPVDGLRVLLVICRPAAEDDVPFRVVASRMVAKLGRRCDVLRPPTIDHLQEVLNAARAAGRGYDVVHFDGHGIYVDLKAEQLHALPDPHSMRGYLVFESEDGQPEYINGALLGQMLRQSQTPVLVLNACRSAHAASGTPSQDGAAAGAHPFTSFAQEAMACGLAGVLAMRFNVFVDSAAEAMEAVYGAMIAGRSLGEGVTLARRALAAHKVQDWYVLEVHERERWAKPPAAVQLEKIGGVEALPPPPEAGFVGRDIALLGLDRAFQSNAVVLLHGFIGSGKTATAAEFARWYSLTGGTAGPVAWVVLPENLPGELAALTIIDGIESVEEAGRPALLALIQAARSRKRKLLLTSRRPETEWLGDEQVYRILLGPITQPDCLELVERWRGLRGLSGPAEAFAPLVRLSFGNPMTLSLLLGMAVAEGVQSEEDCLRLADSLRSGSHARAEQILAGVAPLEAALESFSAGERKLLAPLRLFQEFVAAKIFTAVTGGSADLLVRAARRGLLVEMGEGLYATHPAMCLMRAQAGYATAFVSAYTSVARNFIGQIGRGNNQVMEHYFLEQGNVYLAMKLARVLGDWESEITMSEGLLLWLQLGHRNSEFEQVVAVLETLITGHPEREQHLATLWELQSLVAEWKGDLERAEQLLEQAIERTRPLVPKKVDSKNLTGEQVTLLSQIALELYRRAQIRYAQRNPYCLGDYLEGMRYYQQANLNSLAANCALDVGTACMRLGSDLALAEQSYRIALGLFEERDLLGKAKCYVQLAALELERFENAQTREDAVKALKAAFENAFRALPLLPENATEERAACYSRLGTASRYAGDYEHALEYEQEALRLYDASGPLVHAAGMRLDVANVLMAQYRYPQAAEYLRDAIRQYAALGAPAEESRRDAEQRLAWVEEQIAANVTGPPGGALKG